MIYNNDHYYETKINKNLFSRVTGQIWRISLASSDLNQWQFIRLERGSDRQQTYCIDCSLSDRFCEVICYEK